MADQDTQARTSIYARLAQSRSELRAIFAPPPEYGPGSQAQGNGASGFPRSRTMRMILSGRGLGTVGAMAGGLLLARPGLAFKLLRLLPAGAMAKMFVSKAVGALRSKSRDGA